LGEKLYEACRLCDERATAAERQVDAAKDDAEKKRLLTEAKDYRRRIIDLPDPDDEILQYLPSHAPEAEESGYSQKKAEALCRRLIAVHCLYGVDLNPLAVELAKLALWLESHSEGMPLTFMDHRLLVGNSLTGSFWDKLVFYPGTQQPIDNLFAQDIDRNLARSLREALQHVNRLDISVGMTLAEMREKETARRDLEHALAPFKVLAAAWAGGVMLGAGQCDDVAYANLVKDIGSTGDLPEMIDSERLRAMIALGLGMDILPADRESIYDLVCSGKIVPAFSFDLSFPEVFYPYGEVHGKRGFYAVLGNPPWDEVQPKSLEFLANIDFEILNLPTVREREVLQIHLLSDECAATKFSAYLEGYERDRRSYETLYKHQRVTIDGDLAGRQLSLYRLFMERGCQLLTHQGLTGLVVPSAFHANEGATGVRQLYLEKMRFLCCFSFENRRKLFEIHSSFKFALVVAEKGTTTDSFKCAFYLHDDEWLFSGNTGRRPLDYSLDFVRRTGGEYLSLLELKKPADADVASRCYIDGSSIKAVLTDTKVTPNTSELPMLGPTVFFEPSQYVGEEDTRVPYQTSRLLALGFAPLHEGKTFHQYDDMWGERPKYVARLEGLRDRPRWLQFLRYYRLVYRTVASATNERTSIFTMLPYGVVTARNAASDIRPTEHPYASSLWLIALGNTYGFDFLLRLMVQSAVSLFIMERVAVPSSLPLSFLSHSALRLVCNHVGYEYLWHEQFGDEWREERKPFTWPVLEGDDDRWEMRAAIDAVVANAYGLNREQYEHVLSSFSHKSYLKAPALCLAKSDELHSIGLEAFTRKYDPYWDIALNESLPQPVIDLPMPTQTRPGGQQTLEM